MSAASPAIEARSVGVTIKGTPLISDIDLVIASGEWVSVIGPNGAGKSTLLRALAGVLSATGVVTLFGQPGDGLSRRERAKLVAWVPQTPTLPVGISVFDYVMLGRTPHLSPLGRERTADLEIVGAVLADLDLEPFAARSIETLSGGELQRAVIARALAQQTQIVLLDEPTAALDLGHQQEVLELLDRLCTEQSRCIVTTMHDLTLAGVYADRLVLLSDGRVGAAGSAAEVLTEDNLEHHYGAQVTVRNESGHILVTPKLARPIKRDAT